MTDDAEQVQTVPTLSESSEQWTKENEQISDQQPSPEASSMRQTEYMRGCTRCGKATVRGRTKCADHLPSPDPWERLTPEQKARHRRGLPINEEADNEEAKKAALYAKYGGPNFLGPSPNRPGYLRWAMCRKCKRPASPYSTTSEPRCSDHLEPNAENSR